MATVNEKMTAIADAIREKTGGTEALTLDGMAEAVPGVYEAGKKSEYDAFWDAYQNNGKRTDYRYGFAYTGWKKENFKPKYDIKPKGANGAYMFSSGAEASKFDLAKALEEQGVVLDLSELTSSTNEFYMTRFTKLPVLNFSGCASMANTFDYFIGTEIKLILSESGETTFSSVFRRCSSLTTFAIESGVIGRSISFSDCTKLNATSIKNIVEHLKDYAGTDKEFSYTLTIPSGAFASLEAEGTTAEYNGVACTWAEYIDNKKWNLTLA